MGIYTLLLEKSLKIIKNLISIKVNFQYLNTFIEYVKVVIEYILTFIDFF